MARPDAYFARFAKYYDFIYEQLLDYREDVRYLETIFERFLPRKPQTILDLGCGTGNHDLPLARRGYSVTGLDLSRPQLAIARQKARAARLPIRFVRGDMRSFDLRTSFDAAICMFGAFGYLLTTAEAVRCLRSLRRNLRGDGVFAFEFWQSSGVRVPHETWFHRKGREFELVRLAEARYDPRTKVLAIDFRFVVIQGRKVLDRFDEVHRVRTYTVPEMRDLLHRGGFELVRAFGTADRMKKGFGPVRRAMFRVFAVCRPARR